MNHNELTAHQRDWIIKAVVDGADSIKQVIHWTHLPEQIFEPIREELEQIIGFYSRFERFARESMCDVDFPPPPNPYHDADRSIDGQLPIYYAYEAVSRGNVTRERAIWVCEKLGLEDAEARAALDAVCMPWTQANSWQSYVRSYYDELGSETHLFLQTQTPMKLKPHINRWLTSTAFSVDAPTE